MVNSSTDDTDNVSDYGDQIPPDIIAAAKEVSLDLLPDSSKRLYTATYNNFKSWRSSKKTSSFAEEVFLAYFKEIAQTLSPATLWNKFSMLRATVKTFDKFDLSSYHQLIAYIKKKNAKYIKKKSRIFTAENISKFCNDAPDEVHLCTKVILIFGILGAMRRGELANINTKQVEENDENMILVRIPITKNSVSRFFAIYGEFYEICKKYMALRPTNIEKHNRFFIHYANGKCSRQPIGINTIGQVPKKIATWLSLPEPDLYTGHSLRRTSATLLVDGGGDITDLKRHGGWKSTTVAEGYIDQSLQHKKDMQKKITKRITLKKIDQNILESQSRANKRNRTEQPQPSCSNYPSINNDNESVPDENFQPEDDTFLYPSDTQKAIIESPVKKRRQQDSFSLKSDGGNITLHFNNCNVTININNNKGDSSKLT